MVIKKLAVIKLSPPGSLNISSCSGGKMPGNTRSFLPMSTLNAILLASYGLFTIPEGFSVCCFLVVELVSWGWGGWWKQHTMESDFLYAVGGGGSVGWGRR